jgi:hypothetical protein
MASRLVQCDSPQSIQTKPPSHPSTHKWPQFVWIAGLQTSPRTCRNHHKFRSIRSRTSRRSLRSSHQHDEPRWGSIRWVPHTVAILPSDYSDFLLVSLERNEKLGCPLSHEVLQRHLIACWGHLDGSKSRTRVHKKSLKQPLATVALPTMRTCFRQPSIRAAAAFYPRRS